MGRKPKDDGGSKPKGESKVASDRPLLEAHELADLLPPMADKEYAALVESMRRDGYDRTQPIILLDGKVLDGRHRDRASRDAGVQPCFTDFGGSDPVGYVLRANVLRRHLTESQRAMVAAKLANMAQGERTDLQPSANLQKVSRGDAAKMLKVSPRLVASAAAVQADGTPELIEAAANGKVRVSAAEQIAWMSDEEQRKVVELGNYSDAAKRVKAAKQPPPAPPSPPPEMEEQQRREKAEAERFGAAQDDLLEALSVLPDRHREPIEEALAALVPGFAVLFQEARDLEKQQRQAPQPTIMDVMADGEHDYADDEPLTLERRWQNSLGYLAGSAVATSAYWTKEFGEWQKFKAPSHLLRLAKQAAAAWQELVSKLEPPTDAPEAEALQPMTVGMVAAVVRRLQGHVANAVHDNKAELLKIGIRDIRHFARNGSNKEFKHYLAKYVMDAIKGGARGLGYIDTGTCRVSVERMERPATLPPQSAAPEEKPPTDAVPQEGNAALASQKAENGRLQGELNMKLFELTALKQQLAALQAKHTPPETTH